MGSLMRRAAVVAGAAVVLLGPVLGVASAAGAAAGMRLAAGARALSGGTWGKAEEIPGLATLDSGGNARVNSVSCGPAGNCGAGGFYTDSSARVHAFVISQVNGKWGKAKEAPGTATLNTGGNAVIYSVSCAPAGNCTAGGVYADRFGHLQGFVVSRS